MAVQIKYSDISVDAKINFAPFTDDKQPFIDISKLNKNGLKYIDYSTIGELNQTILDKSQPVFPDDTTDLIFGLWSLSMSDDMGVFTSPVVLELTAEGLYTSQGMTFVFDEAQGCFPTNINMKWYNGVNLVSSKDFKPDNMEYFCENKVENYNKIIITFYSLNFPKRYLKLRSLEFGVLRLFNNDELRAVNVIKEIHPISSEIHINTLDFTLVSKNNVDFVFQTKQPLELIFNGKLDGVYFIEDSTRKAANIYAIQAVDYIGLLDKVTHFGGIYNSVPVLNVLNTLFNDVHIPYTIDAELSEATITGYIPICSCREALMQICYAIGAVADTSTSNVVRIYELDPEIKHVFRLNEVAMSQSISQSDKMTEFQLTEHAYSKIETMVDLYKAVDSGAGRDILVTFSEPIWGMSITNGTITKSGTNYAVINAETSECVLNGKQYNHTTRIISKKNPLINVGDLQNVIKVETATLINNTNSVDIATKSFEYFMKNISVNSKLIITDSDVGDTVSVETSYLGQITGTIESMRYSLNGNKILAETVVK